MGTSSARRGPSTAAWRWAKGGATRYLSPESAAPVEAREVVRRYVAALAETSAIAGQDILAGFRLTRKVAQNLGDFWETAAASGLPAALAAWGLADLAPEPPEAVMLGLAAAWVEEDGGLEAAVARAALATCLAKVLTAEATPRAQVDSNVLVKQFLALVLSQRLALDLGESLEAAAQGWLELQDGMTRLHDAIASAIAATGPPPPPGQWRGLAGWLWLTQTLEAIFGGL